MLKPLRLISLTSVVLAAAVAAAVAVAPGPALAATKDKIPMDVHTQFRVTFDVTVSYEHKQYWSGGVEDNASLGYRLTGPVGTATFVNGVLDSGVVGTVKQRIKADLSTSRVHGDGTSATCSGGAADVRGFVGLGRASEGVTWLAPLLGANVEATCQDSDGRSSTDTLSFAAVASGPVQTVTTAVPDGAVALGITNADTEKTEFLKPHDITVKSHRCPGYDTESTTSCVLRITGDTTYIRTSRWETPDMDDVLASDELPGKPKLDRNRTKATTTVKCKRDCDAGIEVFQFPKRKAPMKAFARPPRVRIKAGRTSTLTAKLDAADRRGIAAQGAFAVVTIKAAGKTRRGVYLLAPPPAG